MGKTFHHYLQKIIKSELFVITGHNTFDATMFENKIGGSIFPPEANLVKLIAELIYIMIINHAFYIVCKIIWYRRCLDLLEKALESPGKVLEFHI